MAKILPSDPSVADHIDLSKKRSMRINSSKKSTNPENINKDSSNVTDITPILSSKSRKERASSGVKDLGVMKLYGNFFRLLRKRVEITCEALAAELGYNRPTQIIRIEAGIMGAPINETEKLSGILNCDPQILLFARMAAFDPIYFRTFSKYIGGNLNYSNWDDPEKFLKTEIKELKKLVEDNNYRKKYPEEVTKMWHGVISKT